MYGSTMYTSPIFPRSEDGLYAMSITDTIWGCLRALSNLISRRAVMGSPSLASYMVTFFSATLRPVDSCLPCFTSPNVPCPNLTETSYACTGLQPRNERSGSETGLARSRLANVPGRGPLRTFTGVWS